MQHPMRVHVSSLPFHRRRVVSASEPPGPNPQPPQPSPEPPTKPPPPPVWRSVPLQPSLILSFAPQVIMPTVTGSNGEQIDVLSRLLKDRILLLGSEVNDEVANVLVAQMLYLANEDPSGDITLYINSPGGSVSAGMAIYDTMQFIPCDVSTVCFGMAASMGAFLLGAGAQGKRKSLPNARIMIHQPLGGAQGQAADIEIQVTLSLAALIIACLGERNTIYQGLYQQVHVHLYRTARRQDCRGYGQRFLYDAAGNPSVLMTLTISLSLIWIVQEAKEYGLIDEVIKTKTSHINIGNMPSLFAEAR